MGGKFYEHRAYESVDNESLTILNYISKFDGKMVSGSNGLISGFQIAKCNYKD